MSNFDYFTITICENSSSYYNENKKCQIQLSSQNARCLSIASNFGDIWWFVIIMKDNA